MKSESNLRPIAEQEKASDAKSLLVGALTAGISTSRFAAGQASARSDYLAELGFVHPFLYVQPLRRFRSTSARTPNQPSYRKYIHTLHTPRSVAARNCSTLGHNPC
jgi:hypothetical protein